MGEFGSIGEASGEKPEAPGFSPKPPLPSLFSVVPRGFAGCRPTLEGAQGNRRGPENTLSNSDRFSDPEKPIHANAPRNAVSAEKTPASLTETTHRFCRGGKNMGRPRTEETRCGGWPISERACGRSCGPIPGTVLCLNSGEPHSVHAAEGSSLPVTSLLPRNVT